MNSLVDYADRRLPRGSGRLAGPRADRGLVGYGEEGGVVESDLVGSTQP